jgi:hypothetical protein
MIEKEYEYFTIVEVKAPPKRKTKIFHVMSKGVDYISLAIIRWYGPWRQYCLHAGDGTIWSKGCLEDIESFLKEANAEHKRSL